MTGHGETTMQDLDLPRRRVLTFDCYGTLIDWERGILDRVRPWFAEAGITTYPRRRPGVGGEVP